MFFKVSSSSQLDLRSKSIKINGEYKLVRSDVEWEESFKKYQRGRSKNFDTTTQILTFNNTAEFPLIRLNSNLYRDSIYQFTDQAGNVLVISRASKEYAIAHFDSTEYQIFFDTVVTARFERSGKFGRPVSSLFRLPITAEYSVKGRKTPNEFINLASKKVKSCLFSLAVDTGECFEIYKPSEKQKFKNLESPNNIEFDEFSIPNRTYEENIVNYYKVARSSPFPSQSFLAFYHVLEYYFLRISEDSLHHQLKGFINDPNFKSNTDGLDKIISLVRKQAAQDDETEMLRKVLHRFVTEDDFIKYVSDI
jgi:hypothetical protein